MSNKQKEIEYIDKICNELNDYLESDDEDLYYKIYINVEALNNILQKINNKKRLNHLIKKFKDFENEIDLYITDFNLDYVEFNLDDIRETLNKIRITVEQ